MKNFFKKICLLLILFLSLGIFVSCGDDNKSETETVNKISIKITNNLDENVDIITLNEEGKINFNDLKVTSREGYRFDGYYLEDKIFDFDTIIKEDITLTEKWTKVDLTITFDLDGYGKNSTITIPYNSSLTNFPKINVEFEEKRGLEFLGWYIGDEEYKNSTKILEDTTVKAKWLVNAYNISFDVEDENFPKKELAAKDKIFDPMMFGEPIRKGYTFAGWYLNDKLYEPQILIGDINLKAKWNPNKMFVDFKDELNHTDVREVALYDSYATAREVLPVKGKTFLGWYLEDKPFDFTKTKITENITLVAKWEDTTYTVNFNDGSKNLAETMTVTYGKNYKLPELKPTNGQYTFGGWFTGIGGAGEKLQNEGTWNYEVETIYAYWLGTEGISYYKENPNNPGDGFARVIGYTGTSKNVLIPDYVDGLKVIAIANGAFTNSIVEEVTLGKNIKSIWNEAFSGSAIKKVNFNDNITDIGDGVFKNCLNLENIDLSNIEKIGKYLFLDSTNLKSVELPTNLEKLPRDIFYGCTSLAEIVLPDNLKEIEECAFYGATGLTNIVIPTNVNKIGNLAFSYCDSLTEIVIPEGVTELLSVFSYCKGLTKVTLPSTIKTISNTFIECEALTDIIGQFNLEVIGENTFFNCKKLESFYLSNTIKTIEKMAFYNCNSLILNNLNLASLISVGDSAFMGLDSIFELKFSESLEIIGDSAFLSCENLHSVDFPTRNFKIGAHAFQNCSSLSSIKWPYKLEAIPDYAFAGTGLEFIYIPGSIKTIGDYAFMDAKAKKVIIDAKLDSVGAKAFSDNPVVTIQYGNNAVNIDLSSFSAFMLEHIYLPDSIESFTFFDEFYIEQIINNPEYKIKLNKYNGGYYLGDGKSSYEHVFIKISDDFQGSNLEILNKCKAIADNAIKNNNYIKTIHIPDCKCIGKNNYDESLPLLTDVYYEGYLSVLEAIRPAKEAVKEFKFHAAYDISDSGEFLNGDFIFSSKK